MQLARIYRWRSYHTWWSQHSAPGFPDLVLLRPPRLIFAELKVHARVTGAQETWLNELALVPGVETYLWRPADMQHIAEVLR
jgi:hypothetical protein